MVQCALSNLMARNPNRFTSSSTKSASADQGDPNRVITSGADSGIDQVLISRIRTNDVSALDELIHLHARKLGTIAFAIVGSNDIAEEAVHDVFLKLWEHRESNIIEGDLLHYLVRATRNQALNLLRREKSQWDRAQNAGDASGGEKSFSTNEGIEALYAEDLRSQVYNALRAVPPRCREIFLMSWEGEMTYAEISQILQISLPTVHNQMSRATQKVAEYLRRRASAE